MKQWWRRSIAAQFIILMMLALVGSQALSLLVSWDERERMSLASAKGEFFSRTAAVTRLIESIPPSLLSQALAASETSNARFWVSPEEPGDAGTWRRRSIEELQRQPPDLRNMREHYDRPIPLATEDMEVDRIAVDAEVQPWQTPPPLFWASTRPSKFTYLGELEGFGLAVQLTDGQWLNSVYYRDLGPPWWMSQSLVSVGIAAVVLSLFGLAIANQIARPLRRLSAAAEALGRGETVPQLPETGPDDIRQTAAAFNTMQARLHRFVADRTRMLAAIGHDLRTPLTSLRLRTEFVTDDELKDRMLATIDEIQTMTEAAVALARGESAQEETRTVDLDALIGSLCEDMADLGAPVTYREGEKTIYRCRPDGIRRAVRNLVENALRYGGSAAVCIERQSNSVQIAVEDKGPGIPDDMTDQVFAPFFRLEGSRNRETGGVGLGLSIARTIVRQHGGDILLVNNDPGLRAVILLPHIETDITVPAKGALAAVA